MNTLKTGIFWFNNDLRLHDNPALMRANSLVDSLLCIYIKDASWRSSSRYPISGADLQSKQFLSESLNDLDKKLNNIGQHLIVIEADAVTALNEFITHVGASDVFRSDNAGWYENSQWRKAKHANPDINFHSICTHTLFDLDVLPFSLQKLPDNFTSFENLVKDTHPINPIVEISYLPPLPSNYLSTKDNTDFKQSINQFNSTPFLGGETQALKHLANYFSSEKPLSYKLVRNAIDGWDNSCKLSPWLANGCLSVREVLSTLFDYEKQNQANDSTYWIYFELLWREYFQWYAHKTGSKLFAFNGIKKRAPLNSYYPERFQKWVHGSTPYPIVNACMNELKATGYLSNRGRQIVASCFVNELAMDWRYGAAYFEQVLLDYDVGSNWGNWQYLAGVGADSRGKRHFNLEKQRQQHDPDGRYISLWKGESSLQALDSVDAADWPIL